MGLRLIVHKISCFEGGHCLRRVPRVLWKHCKRNSMLTLQLGQATLKVHHNGWKSLNNVTYYSKFNFSCKIKTNIAIWRKNPTFKIWQQFFSSKFIGHFVKSKQTFRFDGKNPTFAIWQQIYSQCLEDETLLVCLSDFEILRQRRRRETWGLDQKCLLNP